MPTSDDLLIFHNRRALADVACLKASIKECYGPYGLRVQERGLSIRSLAGSKMNAAKLLTHLARMPWGVCNEKSALEWTRELFYPKVGLVLGCFALRVEPSFMSVFCPIHLLRKLFMRLATSWDWSIACISAS